MVSIFSRYPALRSSSSNVGVVKSMENSRSKMDSRSVSLPLPLMLPLPLGVGVSMGTFPSTMISSMFVISQQITSQAMYG